VVEPDIPTNEVRTTALPRRRQIDLAIAATAQIAGVLLLTHNLGDFEIIKDLVDIRRS